MTTAVHIVSSTEIKIFFCINKQEKNIKKEAKFLLGF